MHWVDIKLAQRKGLKFYQEKIERHHPLRHTPSIANAVIMETGEIIYERVYASPRPPPKISFQDNWRKELGSEVAGGGENSQQTQPKTKNPIVRTGRLVSAEQPSGSPTQEIDKGVLFDGESTNVSTSVC